MSISCATHIEKGGRDRGSEGGRERGWEGVYNNISYDFLTLCNIILLTTLLEYVIGKYMIGFLYIGRSV